VGNVNPRIWIDQNSLTIAAFCPENTMTQAAAKLDVRLKRAYLPPSAEDGIRVLVDRLWPRGVRKTDAAIDRWLKEIAPSTELRRWFGHDPSRWEGFRRRYRAELSQNATLLNELRVVARKGPLTLVYAARDEVHNEAVVLRDVLAH
jgi:uncharacterized protein YeaO (DUF488 family)